MNSPPISAISTACQMETPTRLRCPAPVYCATNEFTYPTVPMKKHEMVKLVRPEGMAAATASAE